MNILRARPSLSQYYEYPKALHREKIIVKLTEQTLVPTTVRLIYDFAV